MMVRRKPAGQTHLPNKIYDELVPIFGLKRGVFKHSAACRIMHVSAEKGQQLVLREPAVATITVTVTKNLENERDIETLTASARVPQLGETYSLPIQRPPLFGENKF